VAILMAWKGYGVWSLAVQFLLSSALRVLSGWWVVDWRPLWVFSWLSIRSLFKSSSFLFLAEVSNALFSRINTLVIGKFYSAADLGYYSRADGVQTLPGGVLTGIIDNVAFPVFSSVNHDTAFLRAGLKKSITIVMMLSMPIMVGMMVTAKPLVQVLFGVQWLPCVPYIQILCLRGLFLPLLILNGSLHKSLGVFSLIFRVEIAKRILVLLLLAIACPFGVAAIAWSTVLISVLNFMVGGYYSGKFVQYGLMQQIVDLAPCIGGSLVMASGVWALSWLPIHPPIVMLAVQTASGAAIFVAFCHVFKLAAFTDAVAIVRSRLPFGRA
jgi:O-antigen/teichoic acid export membrane protein